MNSAAVGVIIFVCTFGGVLGGMGLRPFLPSHLLNDETKDTVKLGIGLIATMTALVLGLITASAKSSHDALNLTIRQAAADILSLDRALDRYGPDTAGIRQELKSALVQRIAMLWPADHPPDIAPDPLEAARNAEVLATRIHGLAAQTDAQRRLQSRALDLGERVLESRWLAFAGHGPSIPTAFLVTLAFWLTVTFTSFGLFAPRNAMVVAVMFVCALSVAGAVFLVLELDGSFEGFIRVSAAPLEYAVGRIGQ